MRSLAKRLDRLEHAFGLLSAKANELDFAQLNQLLPEERRERIVQLSLQIAQRRRIVPAPGEPLEDAVHRVLKQIAGGNGVLISKALWRTAFLF
jgi:hypothetical protein